MPIQLKSIGGGSITLDVPNTANSYNITLPASTAAILNTESNLDATKLTNAVAAANGGTGLTSSGTSGNFLVSTGSTWVSQTPASAFNSTGTAPIFPVRAWVTFNGTGTTATNQTIRASGNVASVYKNQTGDFTITFTTALPSTNYLVLANARGAAGTNNHLVVTPYTGLTAGANTMVHQAPTTTTVRIAVSSLGGTRTDSDYINVMVVV